MHNKTILGVILALGAALLNGTVGFLSKGLFLENISPAAVSFYKCLLAFITLSCILVFNRKMQGEVKRLVTYIPEIVICSFLGIFVLYYFETSAYKFDTVPIVVFILLGSSAVTTFILSTFILKEKKNLFNYIGLILLIIGLCLMEFSHGLTIHISTGVLLAAIAGVGYGSFLVLTKKFSLDGGLSLIWYFMLFGVIYLFFPFYHSGMILPDSQNFLSLMALAILPTIGGFYCTTKALTLLAANKVQTLELTEPLFAMFFAFLLLGEYITGYELIGAFIILTAIYISEYQPNKQKITI